MPVSNCLLNMSPWHWQTKLLICPPKLFYLISENGKSILSHVISNTPVNTVYLPFKIHENSTSHHLNTDTSSSYDPFSPELKLTKIPYLVSRLPPVALSVYSVFSRVSLLKPKQYVTPLFKILQWSCSQTFGFRSPHLKNYLKESKELILVRVISINTYCTGNQNRKVFKLLLIHF